MRLAGRTRVALLLAAAVIAALAPGAGPASAVARAEPLEDDGGAEWRLERVLPPPLQNGERSGLPVGLGKVGDIEFVAPNKGLAITAGNGNTIPAGLWAYSVNPAEGGENRWHELATVCGATDGRIAWAGPEEFWTISDGRPGQAANARGESPPLEDNTLCHFAGGAVSASYASPAFQVSSYQAMHAAGCISRDDCWFGGDGLPEGQLGAFHLHWRGSGLVAEPFPEEAHAVEDMRVFGGRLFESVRLAAGDAVAHPSPEPPVVHLVNPAGISPTFEGLPGLPLYGPNEFPEALDYLRLSSDELNLWAAAGAVREAPAGSEAAQTTVVRDSAEGGWSEVVGPQVDSPSTNPLAEKAVNSIAAEPGTGSAWVALDSQVDAEHPSPTEHALVARVRADGTVTDEQVLPSPRESSEGVGPKGAAAKITCPAAQDCWMVTTQGWLYHLSNGAPAPPDDDPAFTGLITFRPPDEGLPQVVPDAPPVDDSGLLGELPSGPVPLLELSPPAETRITVPLVSHLRSRLVHGTMLELRFHLAAPARVRLVARRRKRMVAATAARVFAAGDRKLLLRLNRRNWPTKLDLQTHALGALPTTSTRGAGNDSVSTGLVVLPRTPAFTGPFG